MKIPLKNKILEIRLLIGTVPDLGKLNKELQDFFSQNEVEGHQIKRFRVELGFHAKDYDIVPLEPPIEGCLSGRGIYIKGLEEIGKKYGIENLDFAPWCYHK